MRVIECDYCGETISGATDAELAGRLAAHLQKEHDESPSDEELEELIAEEAYDALDS
jgi:predicted small metal-binding protein